MNKFTQSCLFIIGIVLLFLLILQQKQFYNQGGNLCELKRSYTENRINILINNDEYQIGDFISRGAFGGVYNLNKISSEAQDKMKLVVKIPFTVEYLKAASPEDFKNMKLIGNMKIEASIVDQMCKKNIFVQCAPNLMEAVPMVTTNQMPIIIMPKLKELPKISNSPEMVNYYIESISETLFCLFRNGFFTFDLKLNNIMLDPLTGEIKLSDLGGYCTMKLLIDLKGKFKSIYNYEYARTYATPLYTVIEKQIETINSQESGSVNLEYINRAEVYQTGLCILQLIMGDDAHEEILKDLHLNTEVRTALLQGNTKMFEKVEEYISNIKDEKYKTILPLIKNMCKSNPEYIIKLEEVIDVQEYKKSESKGAGDRSLAPLLSKI